MTYIENIFLCLALPLILSLFFMKGRVRRYALFLTVGMAVCLLSAYVSSFFMGQNPPELHPHHVRHVQLVVHDAHGFARLYHRKRHSRHLRSARHE